MASSIVSYFYWPKLVEAIHVFWFILALSEDPGRLGRLGEGTAKLRLTSLALRGGLCPKGWIPRGAGGQQELSCA